MNYTIAESDYIESKEKSMFDPYFTYVYANYATLLETAGAQVVPIMYGEDWETTVFKLERLNGVVFPGGDAQDPYHNWGK